MGELGFNKIFGALLAVVLVIMGLREVSGMVFSTGGSYHGKEYTDLNEWAASKFPGYRIEIADAGGAGGEVVEEIYDLGLLLASADASRGERIYNAQCASCHTIEQGGSNLTGPNLYNKLGGAKQGKADFANYSGALGNTEGDWSWQNMDAWLENPSAYARGTSMAYAGLRRDNDRAAVLLYLAANSEIEPAQPEPLPVVAAEDGVEDVAGSLDEALEENPTLATGVIETQDAAIGENTELVSEATADVIDPVTTMEGEGDDVTAPVDETDGYGEQ